MTIEQLTTIKGKVKVKIFFQQFFHFITLKLLVEIKFTCVKFL